MKLSTNKSLNFSNDKHISNWENTKIMNIAPLVSKSKTLLCNRPTIEVVHKLKVSIWITFYHLHDFTFFGRLQCNFFQKFNFFVGTSSSKIFAQIIWIFMIDCIFKYIFVPNIFRPKVLTRPFSINVNRYSEKNLMNRYTKPPKLRYFGGKQTLTATCNFQYTRLHKFNHTSSYLLNKLPW